MTELKEYTLEDVAAVSINIYIYFFLYINYIN